MDDEFPVLDEMSCQKNRSHHSHQTPRLSDQLITIQNSWYQHVSHSPQSLLHQIIDCLPRAHSMALIVPSSHALSFLLIGLSTTRDVVSIRRTRNTISHLGGYVGIQ